MKKAKKRLLILSGILAAAVLVISLRTSWLSLGTDRRETTTEPGFIRGPITDRRGLTLAMTEEASTIALAPPEIIDPEFTAEQLSRFLDMTPEEILKKIYIFSDRKYFLLIRQVDNFKADQILELNLPGVYREPEFRRFYPGDSLASNLIGFTGRDQENALSGIEYIYNDILNTPESRLNNRGPALNLTIDSLIQYRLESIMKEAFEKSGSKLATGIFMDIKTGEILALANFPNFNPNKYYESTPFQRGNWALRLNYEPGSTVKVLMAGILLTEKAVFPGERFLCDGEFRRGNVVIRDRSGGRTVSHGSLTLPEIITVSSNVGIIKAMERVRRDRFYHYMSEFGFGQKTGVFTAGQGETSGYLPPLKNWVPSTAYYMPIGQGFSVTPLQLLRAAASIANGGKLVDPFIVNDITLPGGEKLDSHLQNVKMNPFPPAVNREVVKMMRRVVTDGTGRRALIPEAAIIGKTGTGQKSSARGYEEKFIASFIGFFPEKEPRYGGIILFDEPPDDQGGGSIAAPVFRDLTLAVLPLLQSGYKSEKVPVLKPLEPVTLKIKADKLFNFQGLSAREALDINNIYYKKEVKIKGSGFVYRQQPPPGSNPSDFSEIILYLDESGSGF